MMKKKLNTHLLSHTYKLYAKKQTNNYFIFYIFDICVCVFVTSVCDMMSILSRNHKMISNQSIDIQEMK